MNLKLRKAGYDDMDLLYKWANDKDVRRNAFNSEPIPYDNHIKWFNKVMNDDTILQYILCDDNEPIGQIRLDIEGYKAYIDYSISYDKRGLGLGSIMIRLLINELLDSKSDVKELVGQVKYENYASAKVFEKCNFIRMGKADYIEYYLAMEKKHEDNNSNY